MEKNFCTRISNKQIFDCYIMDNDHYDVLGLFYMQSESAQCTALAHTAREHLKLPIDNENCHVHHVKADNKRNGWMEKITDQQ